MDEATELANYLPLSFKTPTEKEYIKFLWDAFETNYTHEKFQFAFLAYGRVRYGYAPFAHHGDQVSITELKAQIPADAQNHDLPIEVPTLEQLLDRYEVWHPSIIAECGRVCTRAVSPTYMWHWLYTTSPATTRSIDGTYRDVVSGLSVWPCSMMRNSWPSRVNVSCS